MIDFGRDRKVMQGKKAKPWSLSSFFVILFTCRLIYHYIYTL